MKCYLQHRRQIANESIQQYMANIEAAVPEKNDYHFEEPINMEEVTEAMKQLKPSKASRTDGLCVEFYKCLWNISGEDIFLTKRT